MSRSHEVAEAVGLEGETRAEKRTRLRKIVATPSERDLAARELLEVETQIADHLKCYKVTDPLRLSGVVDLNSPQFGAETGCIISKARLFCVPVTKNVVSAEDRAWLSSWSA